MGRLIWFLLLLLPAGCARHPAAHPAWADLVAAEEAFAQASAVQGMRAAFLAFLDEEAVLFRPVPVNGPDWMRAQPDVPGVLRWTPAFADIAGSGDLGYTTGPWIFTPHDTTAEAAYGHYATVWQRQPDGSWRVMMDMGNRHGAVPLTAGAVARPRLEGFGEAPPADVEAARDALLEADRACATAALAEGLAAAYRAHAAASVRFYPQRAMPLEGLPAVAAYLEAHADEESWAPLFAGVSRAGDLGYTYGRGEARDARGGVAAYGYLHLWRRDAGGAWRLVLHVSAPIPPTPSTPS